ncbi:MAG: tetratricopeptide repeat protein [Bryobacterales bacterium]|nr:tetratricopeptide repeat protein [Bryobacteraceae bacterium]MDW8355838.1 tetratricopeptide repeat protein [Bryobacterales bacterium]
MVLQLLFLGMAVGPATVQAQDPAYEPLEKAYAALRARDYETAVARFEEAIRLAPQRPSIRKDFAYLLLRIGEREAARDQFAEAMRLAPEDTHVALEYAFLCHETGKTAEARRIFDQIRTSGGPEARATAEQAFENIDRPLREGIARWKQALALRPGDFSAHYELARLAEQRGDHALAAAHYYEAWKLRPQLRSLLIPLGRARQALGDAEGAMAALLSASRSLDTRTAEEARTLLPERYPYVYEFQNAIRLDPTNIELRREYAYLLLAMGHGAEAEDEFRSIVEVAPKDWLSVAQLGFLHLARDDWAAAEPLLNRVLQGDDEALKERVRRALEPLRRLRQRTASPEPAPEVKVLAERSYQAGYLKDALKYYTAAHEQDPLDFSVILRLAWTHNLLRQDEYAIRWFELARKSPDPHIAAEATKAYRNLRPDFQRVRTTVWVFPIYSTRWRDLFSYGQVKTEIRLGRFPLRPYLSLRFIGDTRRTTGGASPQYLSESSFIGGLGVTTRPWRGFVLWGEAGSAVSYLAKRRDVPRAAPDYRGGVSFAKGFGRLLGSEASGPFFELNADGVFISRFDNDTLLYWQNRFGWTSAPVEALGGLQWQLYWNGNLITDARRQYWANLAESGPGVRLRWKWMPRSVAFSVNAVWGRYLIQRGNPWGVRFHDVRVGMWYAATR